LPRHQATSRSTTVGIPSIACLRDNNIAFHRRPGSLVTTNFPNHSPHTLAPQPCLPHSRPRGMPLRTYASIPARKTSSQTRPSPSGPAHLASTLLARLPHRYGRAPHPAPGYDHRDRTRHTTLGDSQSLRTCCCLRRSREPRPFAMSRRWDLPLPCLRGGRAGVPNRTQAAIRR
jgi:hypothetical protein